MKRQILAKIQPKFAFCSQNLPFHRIIKIGLKTGIFDPFNYKVAMEKTNFLWLKLFFWISSSVPLQWLSSKKLMECLKGQRFQFLGMFQWFCEKANFGWILAKFCLFTESSSEHKAFHTFISAHFRLKKKPVHNQSFVWHA